MTKPDLCVCGPTTVAEGLCECGARAYESRTTISGLPLPPWWYHDTTGPDKEETILQEADRLVSDDRREDYGHPLDDFGRVTRMAHALWGRGPETEEEHAMYMILVKLARQVNRAKRDNLVDIAGYAKTLDLVIAERALRKDLGPQS